MSVLSDKIKMRKDLLEEQQNIKMKSEIYIDLLGKELAELYKGQEYASDLVRHLLKIEKGDNSKGRLLVCKDALFKVLPKNCRFRLSGMGRCFHKYNFNHLEVPFSIGKRKFFITVPEVETITGPAVLAILPFNLLRHYLIPSIYEIKKTKANIKYELLVVSSTSPEILKDEFEKYMKGELCESLK